MESFFKYDPLAICAKGLVFIGEAILVYRRDDKTDKYPLCLDLPGGRREGRETPFETFQREVREEFNLKITPEDIVYTKRYLSIFTKHKSGYYVVAKLPASAKSKIVFGPEGLGYTLMSLDTFLARKDAWPVYQQYAAEYIESLNQLEGSLKSLTCA